VLQRQHEALHAAVAGGEEFGEVAAQPAQWEQQGREVLDLVAEFDAGSEAFGRAVQVLRVGRVAEQAIDLRQQLGTEASRQPRARQI
jgi:hypothetical protein